MLGKNKTNKGLILLLLFLLLSSFSCSTTKVLPYDKIHVSSLHTPIEVSRLYTSGDWLIARTDRKGIIYVWSWDDLDKEPKVFNLHSKSRYVSVLAATLMAPCISVECDRVIVPGQERDWNPDTNEYIVFWDIDKDREVNRFELTDDMYCSNMSVSKNGIFVALGLGKGNEITRVAIISNYTDENFPTYTLSENYGDITGFAASEDGHYIAALEKIVDTKTGRIIPVQVPYGMSCSDTNICFSPDSKRIFFAGDASDDILCFEVDTGKFICRLPYETKKPITFFHIIAISEVLHRITSMDISPDGNYLAVSSFMKTEFPRKDNYKIYIYDLQTYKQLFCFNVRSTRIAFSPDSDYLASICYGRKTIDILKIDKN